MSIEGPVGQSPRILLLLFCILKCVWLLSILQGCSVYSIINMPTRCSAPHCCNSTTDGYTFKPIPIGDDRQQWLDVCGSREWNPPKSGKLCEVHFDTSLLYCVDGRKYLRKNAVPSFFCTCSVPSRRKLHFAAKENEHISDHLYSAQSKKPLPLQPIQNSPRVYQPLADHPYSASSQNRSSFHSDQSSSRENLPPPDHGYSARPEKRKTGKRQTTNENTPPSRKRWYKFPHAADCVVMRPPARIQDLPEEFPTPMMPPTSPTESGAAPSASSPVPAAATRSLPCVTPVPDTATSASHVNSPTLPTSVPKKKKLQPLRSAPPSFSNALLKEKDERIEALQKELKILQKEKEKAFEIVESVLGADQQKAVYYGTTKGSPWSDETVKKGLALRQSCGTTGYNNIIKSGTPLPAVRTLQRKLEHIKFDPGVLEFVFEAMEVVVPRLPARVKKCALIFDEMSIKMRLDFDKSTGKYIGYVTLPGGGKEELACKAVLFQLVGLGKRWKSFVAYHFTPDHQLNEGMKDVIFEILHRSHHVGLEVEAIVCDMGNRGLLNAMGFRTRKNEMIFEIPNPSCPERPLLLMPDSVHVFKSAKEMLMKHLDITLPDDVVHTYGLPTNKVDMRHVEWLEEYQTENCRNFKLAPKLKKADIHASHFVKMKVTSATNVINFKTATALDFLAQQGEGPSEMTTTAWFVRLLTSWFNLMTGRNLLHAFSFRNMKAYEDAIALLNLVVHVFRNMKVGEGKAEWKPNQTHVIIATECMLTLQNRFLNEEGFDFFCGGWATQDNMENAFSNIRRGRPKPSALDFKFSLKTLCIVGQDGEISNASYSSDKVPSLIDFCLKMEKQPAESRELNFDLPSVEECEELSSLMQNLVFYVSGYVIFKLFKAKSIPCEECFRRLQATDQVQPMSRFVEFSDYAPDALIRASPEVFSLLSCMERVLYLVRSHLVTAQEFLIPSLVEHFKTTLSHLPLSTCHNVREKLITRYIRMRLPQLSNNLTADMSKQANSARQTALASRTMGSALWSERYRTGERVAP